MHALGLFGWKESYLQVLHYVVVTLHYVVVALVRVRNAIVVLFTCFCLRYRMVNTLQNLGNLFLLCIISAEFSLL